LVSKAVYNTFEHRIDIRIGDRCMADQQTVAQSAP
jgi:hypothetical protein